MGSAERCSPRPDAVSAPGAIVDPMESAVWTAIGLVAAASIGTLFYLGARIDSLSARMDARFDRMDARFDHIDQRFDHVDDRFDAIEARLDATARIDSHLGSHTA